MRRTIRRNRAFLALSLITVLLVIGCKRVVEIEDPMPDFAEYCFVGDNLSGRWASDSVKIITKVDTIDSLIIDEQPTLIYFIETECNEEEGFFLLEYQNFSGVVTEDQRSINFEAGNGSVFVYDEFDDAPDTTRASFRLRYQLLSDSLLTATFKESPNPGQETTYRLFMKRRR